MSHPISFDARLALIRGVIGGRYPGREQEAVAHLEAVFTGASFEADQALTHIRAWVDQVFPRKA